MTNFEVFILNHLLEAYERSRHYKGEARINRRVRFPFRPKTFPEYFDETRPAQKALANKVARDLEDDGLIKIEWVPFEEGNLIDAVTLVLEAVEAAYRRGGLTPKQDAVGEVRQQLTRELAGFTSPWIRSFLTDSLREAEATRDFPRNLPKEPEAREILLAALHGIERIAGEELPERVFSRRFLGGSKALWKVRSRLAAVIRRYLPESQGMGPDALPDEESALQAVGITKSLEELLFCGPLEIGLHGATIDFAPFSYGAAMNTDMIKVFTVRALPVRRIITFENKTNYLDFTRKNAGQDTLGVYLAGFHSPVKCLFLQKVTAFLRETVPSGVEYLHWGDIDLGGFRIFVHLKNQVLPELRPYRMDAETLLRYRDYGDPFGPAYARELEKLLERPEYGEFHATIREMLRRGLRLEQEAILIEP